MPTDASGNEKCVETCGDGYTRDSSTGACVANATPAATESKSSSSGSSSGGLLKGLGGAAKLYASSRLCKENND